MRKTITSFFASEPTDGHSAGVRPVKNPEKGFWQRPMGQVIGATAVLGVMAGGVALYMAAPQAAIAIGIATAYIYGNIQAAIAIGKVMENKERRRQAEKAKKDARDAAIAKLKKQREAEKSGHKPPPPSAGGAGKDADGMPDIPGGDPAPRAEDSPDILSRIDRRRVLRVLQRPNRRMTALPRP
ncbi:MAG: hypothetical protein Alpg2KO_12640 [Alphaproteobacteria bacterium]